MSAATFAALAEPHRLQIVELLRNGPRSVGEIVDALGLRQPQVSKHLGVLSGAGLVAAEPLARKRIYHLERAKFAEIADWVDSFEAVWDARLDSLGVYLSSIDPGRHE